MNTDKHKTPLPECRNSSAAGEHVRRFKGTRNVMNLYSVFCVKAVHNLRMIV